MNIRSLFFLSALICMAGCTGKNAQILPAENFDPSISPKDNFYQYATGGWQKLNPLKPEYSRYGSFDILAENTRENLNDLFEEMATRQYEAGTVEQKIADLYKMGLDSAKVNAEDNAPIMDGIAAIEALQTKDDIIRYTAAMHNSGTSAFFSASVMEDLMDSNSQILYLSQSGLGIGDRDYYVAASDEAIRKGYKNFLNTIFGYSGLDNCEARVEDAFGVETALANVSWTKVQEREITNLYNPFSTAGIIASYPSVNFELYFNERGIAPQEKAIVCEPSFFAGLDAIFAGFTVDQLKNYLLGMYIQDASSYIGERYYTAQFEFFSRQMSGIQEQKPLWKRAMSVPNSLLGEAVGKMYVEKFFPESSKEKMKTLVSNLQASLGEHIAALDWMTDATKAKALEKLSAFTVKIGYPDNWKDYSSLLIDPSISYLENITNAARWYVADNMSKLGKPTDKTEWGMTPQTVNAYYNPTSNEICFPAGILQPPFFYADADDAVNYGAIGVVIAHEMTHGFDDQGRLFDKDGNMTNWWTDEDAANFKAKTDLLVEQFNQVEILPATDSTEALMANGRFTLGENIADNGGLNIAFTAMKNAFGGVEPAPIDGFTAEQRFFLSYALIWANNITTEEMAKRTKMDEHSLGVNRVNVSVKNITPFFEAFDIHEGDGMFRPESERINIW
ncbi:MAG: M13 family metallopeptidase [Bacteroidales bacterium]|nr:M13 family metallopeptidase [Bacteroidales bacterium]